MVNIVEGIEGLVRLDKSGVNCRCATVVNIVEGIEGLVRLYKAGVNCRCGSVVNIVDGMEGWIGHRVFVDTNKLVKQILRIITIVVNFSIFSSYK